MLIHYGFGVNKGNCFNCEKYIQWHRVEDPDTNLCNCRHLILTKEPKVWVGKKTLQQIMLRKWISTCTRLKLDLSFSPCNSINSKWTKYLNVRRKIFKLFQRKIGNKLGHTGIDHNFKNRILMTQQLRERVDKEDCMKLKSFGTATKTVAKLRRHPTQ
jgi:hypothetical protein